MTDKEPTQAFNADDVDAVLAPAYARRGMKQAIPKNRLPEHEMAPDTVYQLIHDELMLDGNSRLNMATFVTTWMEPQAEQLMAEAFDKNMIDKDEYPQTAEIETRCVNIVSNLFNAPEPGVGASTIGSSEAVMLAGMALKWKLARAPAGRRQAERQAEPGPGRQRPGGVGEVLPLLGDRAALHPDAEGPLRDHARRGDRPHRREHDRRRRHPRHHLHRRVRADRGHPRRAGRAEREDRLADPDARRRGQRRIRRPVPASGPEVGLPPAAGEVDQRLRPQIRPGLPRHRLGGLAWSGRPARRSGLPRQLSRRRHADLHAQLLPPRQPGGRQYYNFLRLGRPATGRSWSRCATPR
jgi:hypothetical protein